MTYVINSHNAKQLKDSTSPFMLILSKDETLHESIVKIANDTHVVSASLSGLGALKDPNIAYYNLKTKEYECKTFEGIYELISLNGNISKTEDDETIVHIHVTIGDQHHQVTGGHLMSATVGIVAEITIIPFKGKMIRKLDSCIGLKIIIPQ